MGKTQQLLKTTEQRVGEFDGEDTGSQSNCKAEQFDRTQTVQGRQVLADKSWGNLQHTQVFESLEGTFCNMIDGIVAQSQYVQSPEVCQASLIQPG